MPDYTSNHLTRLLVIIPVVLNFIPEIGATKNITLHNRIAESKCTYIVGQTNKRYEGTVSQDRPMAYLFKVEREYILNSHVSGSHSLQTTNLRVDVGTSNNASLQYPVLFALRQQKYISTLEVPSESETWVDLKQSSSKGQTKAKAVYYHAARTLCIDSSTDNSERNITVRVTTQSRTAVVFYVSLKLSEDFQLPLDKEMTFDVSPTAPRFFGFSFARPDLKQIKIRATSQSSDCLTISVQNTQCPIYDMERNVRYQGLWQTMTTRAAMTVQKMNWFSEGFVLVFVAHEDKEVCGRKRSFGTATSSNTNNRGVPVWGDRYSLPSNASNYQSKTIKVTITDESRISPWIIIWCLLLPIATTFFTALVVLCLFRNRHEWMVDILHEKFSVGSPVSEYLLPSRNTIAVSQTLFDDSANTATDLNSPVNQTMVAAEILLNEIMADTTSTVGSMRMRYSLGTPEAETQGNDPDSCVHWKANLYIANFKCKQFEEVKKFSKRFYWTIAIVAIFYSIPVYQLVLHYLRVLYRTGEYDICYYNYLCAQRLGVLIDFNHFWSNASYVIFGILYIFIVRQRSLNLCLSQQKHPRKELKYAENRRCHHLDSDETESGGCSGCCSRSNGNNSPEKVHRALCCCPCSFSRTCFRWDHGVPTHYGVFYALGVALTMEGFLSAAYHLCPNQSTFQFDTCFMYVIAVLLLLKIYQFRHPVHFGANHTFAILAGFVMVSVLGLLFEQGTDLTIFIFKCVFLPIQYIIMVLLFIYYYAVGYVKNEDGDTITDCSIFGNLGQLRSQPINGDRLFLPLVSLSICVAVLVYTELANIGFASYLLYLLVGNVLGTTLYYVGIMKPLHGEFKNWTWVQPVLYFIAAGIVGGWSLQYFVRAPAQWELSASASRAENEDCLKGWFPFHPFYDSHDAWHFLSAAALFFSFMGLLIVDDDLITTPQLKIPVF